MIAQIDAGLCRGHGQCEQIAGQVFRLGDDERGHVIADTVPPECENAVRDAVLMCPEAAIDVAE